MPKYSDEDCSSVFLKYEIVGARAIFCILALISYENKPITFQLVTLSVSISLWLIYNCVR